MSQDHATRPWPSFLNVFFRTLYACVALFTAAPILRTPAVIFSSSATPPIEVAALWLAWFTMIYFSLSYLANRYGEWQPSLPGVLLDVVQIVGAVCAYHGLGMIDDDSPVNLRLAYGGIFAVIFSSLLSRLFLRREASSIQEIHEFLIGLCILGLVWSGLGFASATQGLEVRPIVALWLLLLTYLWTFGVREEQRLRKQPKDAPDSD